MLANKFIIIPMNCKPNVFFPVWCIMIHCQAHMFNFRQIIADTDMQLIIIIITLFTLFTRITLNVFGKALCPSQSM